MKTIDRMVLAAAACLACAALAGPSAADSADGTQASDPPPSSMSGPSDAMNPSSGAKKPAAEAPAATDAKSVISSWPEKSKTAASALIEKYGPPDAVVDRLLVWNDKDQWKMVAVFRDAVPNNDPMPHEDYVENKISYNVPEDKVGALAKFDHSIVVDQTRGTLASTSDSEKSNILALNIANEIVTGTRDVASAKSFLKKTLQESMAGKSSPYTEGLMFTPSATVPNPGVEPAKPGSHEAPGMPEQP